MLHSKKIMQSMIARRPDEESQDTKSAAPQQSAPVAEPQAAKSEPAYEPEPMPYVDHAQHFLRVAPISEDMKADLWQAYYDAPNSATLAQALQHVDVPNDIKHVLFSLKVTSDPKPGWKERIDKVVGAIKSMTKLDSPH